MWAMRCQLCDKPATVHLTEIVSGQKSERHLCEQCARKEHVTIKAQPGVSELLANLLAAQEGVEAAGDLRCPNCDLTWGEFRKEGLLGCPNDYEAFGEALRNLLERSQEGAAVHRGRVPKGASGGRFASKVKLLRLRQDLKRAVAEEDYEAAAQIRDAIKHVDEN